MEHWAEHEHAALVPCGDRCGQHSGSGGRLHRGEHDDVGGSQCHWRWLRKSNAYGNSNGYAYADSNADCDSNGYAYADSNADCDSNGYAYADSNGYRDSNGYAYTDSYGNCDSNGYAYTDSYGNSYAYTDSYGNGDAYTDTYAYGDGYGPAETKPDTKAISDTAASSVGANSKTIVRELASKPREFPAWRAIG
jgi:hypothetical protein